LWQPALQLVEEVSCLIFCRRLDVRERRKIVEVVVVELVGDFAQTTFYFDEVERDAGVIQLARAQRHLHDVTMPVQALALSVVVPQKVRAVIVRLDTDDVHPGPQLRSRAMLLTSTCGGHEIA
jgi:hypothetical protein